MDPRIVDLEMKCSFLEQTLDTLNEVVLAHAGELELLKNQLERLEKRDAGGGDEVGPQDERPPHY